MRSELRSHFPGCSSRAASSGRAKGSPTKTSALTLSRANGVEQLGRVVTTRLEQADAPAFGQHGVGGEVAGSVHERASRQDGDAARAGLEGSAHGPYAPLDRVVAHGTVDQTREEIVLPPHHTLGHAGGAAGVEHVEVVTAAAPWRGHPRNGGLGGVLVRRGPIGTGPRAVVDPEPPAHAGHPVQNALDAIGEGTVEDDGDGVGVLPQVAQLVVAIAIVRVDRDQPDLDRGEGGLQVLGRVVEIEGDLVLLHRAEVEQELRDAVGPTVELAPGDVALALRHGDRLWLHVRHRLPDVCIVPVAQSDHSPMRADPRFRRHA